MKLQKGRKLEEVPGHFIFDIVKPLLLDGVGEGTHAGDAVLHITEQALEMDQIVY